MRCKLIQSYLLVSLLCLIGVKCFGSEPKIVFTHDTTNQVGNVFDMVELDNGSIAVAGYFGMVFLDREYSVIAKKKLKGAFLNVELARFSNGLGMVGYNRKPMTEDLRIPHLLFISPDLGDISEVRLCDTCSNIGVADFDGDGVDSVIVEGDDSLTVYNLADDSLHDVSKSWFDTKLENIYRVTETDFDCDGNEELMFRAGYDSILEHDNEWQSYGYFVLTLKDQNFELTRYRTHLQNNWRKIRACTSNVKSKDPLKLERYFENFLTQFSPGNVGRYYTDSPVQDYLKLIHLSGAEKHSWEVRMTGMRRPLNFYPLIDTNCVAANESGITAKQDCSRYLSVYAIYGHGCEQFFWEKDDCGTWALLLHPDGTWNTLATWPNWSFASLLTSDGRLLFHSVSNLVEVSLPENLERAKE
ncbi:MAG: VCBS repeat-containing protein [Gammaproteobacteria bacterium]|nr:VCBS repeat-containing protein [Gammaproteobacteria bacterium]MYF37579.1 VCBS repeat-containing protein [Gammaproteobacteria bacterium]